jgi:DNA-binding beta-propeller fold protein YncE
MPPMLTKRPGLLGVASILMSIAVGCTGGASHGAPPVRNSTGGSTGALTTAVSNPFTVVATYSAASLRLRNPRGLAFGPDGNLYVTDATDRVTVVSSGGTVIRRFGGPGKGPGLLTFVTKDPRDPTDLAASIAVGPDGKVYVSDSGNGRVEVFTPTGKFVRQVGSFGINAGQFQLPHDVAVDSTGDLYVVDEQFDTVSKFSPTGKFIWQIGGLAASDPQLRGAELHLASVDSHGRVVITSDAQEAILYIDGNGHKVDSFHTDSPFPQVGPCNVTVDPAGYTFVTSCGGTYTIGECGTPDYPACHRFELVYDRTHRLVGAWYASPFLLSPRFGPNGEVLTLGYDGSILELKVALPDA